jgi:hypothetical protein
MSESSVQSHLDALQEQIQEVQADLEALGNAPRMMNTAEELEALEREIVGLTDRLAGLLIGVQIQHSVVQEPVRQEAAELAGRCPRTLRDHGLRDVRIRPLRGEVVGVRVAYYRPRWGGGRPRRGLYPALVLLGIHDRCTPGLSSEVSLLATALGSLEEACGVLRERGVDLHIKTLRAITYRYAQRARALLAQEQTTLEASAGEARVVVATDGGRLRLRQDCIALKTAKGRKRYHTGWREPKLLHIYTVDAQGRPDRAFMPFIDGTLKGADALFMLLAHYLAKLDIRAAEKVLVVADGAHWIWNRVQVLFQSLGLKADQWLELVDFYHAVEHLGRVATSCKNWSQAERQRWIKHQRHLLKRGHIDWVIEAIRELCRGRRSQALRRERDYFITNRTRMAYERMTKLKLPLGSGAMESAIRRVVNLRLKGAGIFWHKASAEAMLLLRAYYKSGRWNLLKKMAFSVPNPVIA